MDAYIDKIYNTVGSGFFKYKDLQALNIPRHIFRKLFEGGFLEKVQHGLYQISDKTNDVFNLNLDDQFAACSTLINKKSSIGLLSALIYYDLSDEFVDKPVLIVDSQTQTKHKNVILFRKRKPNWAIGIINKGPFNITTIERSIVESIAYKNRNMGYEGIYALKKALKANKTELKNLFLMAKKLGYSKTVNPYLESHLDE